VSCAPEAPVFRLLDAYVGWDQDEVHGLTGLTDPAGLRLARLNAGPDGPGRQELLPWFPDPRLAPGHDRCSWYLATGSALLRRDPCGGGFVPVWACGPAPAPGHAVAVAAPGHAVAVAAPGHAVAVAAAGHWLVVARSDRVEVWWREGEQLVAVLPVRDARVVAVTPAGAVYVARADGTDLWRYRPGGAPDGVLYTGLPGRVAGLRIDRDRQLWLLTEDGDGPHLWRAGRAGQDPHPATAAELAAALAPSTLTATWDGGFCLRDTGPDGNPVDACYSWGGTPLPGPPPAVPTLVTTGELRTTGVDSGLPRCRWHRVSVDADVPVGTAVRLSVAVTETIGAPTEPGDWQDAPPSVTDFLVEQPPGRYLYLRLCLSGDGTATPLVRRIRLDFPRSTSADLLPAAFRQDPAADDFTERFLSLFDSSLSGIDRVITRYPALLDVHGVPDEALSWLGGLLGLGFEAGWSPATRRVLLAAAPELYRRRGTPWAIQEAVRIVFGMAPVVEELAAQRHWLRVGERGAPRGGARGGLGSARLFGRSATRFRVGTSALSTAPLRSFGDPQQDPLGVHAYRFRVVLPPGAASPADEPAVRRLVQAQAPAHTAAAVHVGGRGWAVGIWSAVGIDTAFVPLPAPVLGPAGPDGVPRRGEPVRLGRASVLASSRSGPGRGMAVGERSTVGVQTVAW
jgi:phage tail-like protein